MTRRRRLLAAALLALPGPAAAQWSPATTVGIPQHQAPRAVRSDRRAEPLPLPPPEPPRLAGHGDPAPVPNHDLEAPRAEAQQASPEFKPALIDPAEPQTGTTRDRNSLQAREDRLLRQPAPGARLRLPFSY